MSTSSTLPSWVEVAYTLPVLVLSAEVWFFYNHWLLHHPILYSYCHKVHHEYTSPIALECLYFHPVETVINMGVVGFGPVLCNSHIMVLYAWLVLALLAILLHHSGYELPADGSPGVLDSMSHFHDYHHQNYKRCFGVLGICDKIHGTMEGYDDHVAKWSQQSRRGQR